MLFNSIHFLWFFPVAVLGFYLIHPKRIRYIWLLACSYYFYMAWNPRYALLMLASTAITYLGSLLIGSRTLSRAKPALRKVTLAIVIAANLAILVYFKYSNFLLDEMGELLSLAGVSMVLPNVDVILPVGISFYTFQALSYSIDVYRGEVQVERNFLKYALFVSFFPQLVAGPIERTSHLLSQIRTIERRKIDPKGMYHGLLLMLWGLFLKMVIADRIVVIVDTVFDRYYTYGGTALILAALAFAIQIYCDFSSYSTIAIGAAEVLGFSLMENFAAPYLAGSIKEFWSRWHISLSTWFRDYLYIPLGGSRCSKLRHYRNLMITFLVSGLWHGASLNFIVWGGIHGVLQIAENALAPVVSKINARLSVKTDCFSYKAARVVKTFVLVDLAWIFFRAPGLAVAVDYIRRIVLDFDPWALSQEVIYTLGLDRREVGVLFMALLVLFIADGLRYFKKQSIADALLNQNIPFQYICVTLLVLSIFIFGAYGPAFDAQAFIYFQF